MLDRVAKAAHQFEGNISSPAYILHWSSRDNDLRMWAWPSYQQDNSRVPPDELMAYKCTHYFLNPCCFCSYVDASLGYTESKITLLESINENKSDPERRPFIGEYVAECAREPSCGYFVVLERFYACRTLLTYIYPKRDKPYNPNMFDFLKEVDDEEKLLCGPGTGLRRIFTPQMVGGNFSRSQNGLKRIREEFPEESEKTLSCLDILYDDGVSASEFWSLFVQCAKCGFVMAKHRYPYAHQCPKRPRTIDNLEANQEGEDLSDQSQERRDLEAEEESGGEGGYEYYRQLGRSHFAHRDYTPRDYSASDLDSEEAAYPIPDELSSDDELPDLSTLALLVSNLSHRPVSPKAIFEDILSEIEELLKPKGTPVPRGGGAEAVIADLTKRRTALIREGRYLPSPYPAIAPFGSTLYFKCVTIPEPRDAYEQQQLEGRILSLLKVHSLFNAPPKKARGKKKQQRIERKKRDVAGSLSPAVMLRHV
ncbi:hypothetical protein H1R20_g2682, partial [Candolleomyces eurysporus]